MMKLMKLIGINLLIMVVILALLEVVIRFVFPFYTADTVEIYKYDELTGYTLKSNIDMKKSSDYLQEYYTNDIGTANYENFKIDTTDFIFAVGDSYTFGCGNALEESYPAILDMTLKEDSTEFENTKIVNLGVNGFSGMQNLLRLDQYKIELKTPKYVLYLGCDNDFSGDLLFKQGYKHKHLVEESPYWGIFYKPVKFFLQDLHIGRYAKNIIGKIRRQSIVTQPNISNQNENNQSIASLEAPILDSLKVYCTKNDIKLIVSWVVEQGNTDSYYWTQKWANKNNIAFADWLPKVEKRQEQIQNIEMINIHSGGHYKTWVNYLIAKSYLVELQE